MTARTGRGARAVAAAGKRDLSGEAEPGSRGRAGRGVGDAGRNRGLLIDIPGVDRSGRGGHRLRRPEQQEIDAVVAGLRLRRAGAVAAHHGAEGQNIMRLARSRRRRGAGVGGRGQNGERRGEMITTFGDLVAHVGGAQAEHDQAGEHEDADGGFSQFEPRLGGLECSGSSVRREANHASSPSDEVGLPAHPETSTICTMSASQGQVNALWIPDPC